ncbi:MAG: methylmalonyl Co-A mutase-associated GTPase MeaB [Actinomycetota bacterium]|nr:methylmalonyl Co-A mutase-associated GTPase MeaB [Actinomycetota bacterium]
MSLAERVLKGERRALARLISSIEDGGPNLAEVMRTLYPHTGRAHAVGITGAPGAGKSSVTDRLVARARQDGSSVGVLAVDPSSPFSGGALLGDRVRMQGHATDDGVFIRSMATRGHLGGIALATPEAMRALDAFGLELILVETVGVGQAEVRVADACDTVLVVINPGWGDAVQVAKAGLLEVADVFVLNKADRHGVAQAERELNQMLELSNLERTPEIIRTVATEDEGVDELWTAICSHRSYLEQDQRLSQRRFRRAALEIRDIALERYRSHLDEDGTAFIEKLASDVEARRCDPYEAADRLLEHTAERGSRQS